MSDFRLDERWLREDEADDDAALHRTEAGAAVPRPGESESALTCVIESRDMWRIGLAVVGACLASATASLFIFAAALDCQLDCESPWVVIGGYAPLGLLAAGALSARRRNLRPLVAVGAVVLTWQAAVLIYASATVW